MIRQHLNNRHAVRLEWVVIWLILVEVSGGHSVAVYCCPTCSTSHIVLGVNASQHS
jgi:hypothetical protein